MQMQVVINLRTRSGQLPTQTHLTLMSKILTFTSFTAQAKPFTKWQWVLANRIIMICFIIIHTDICLLFKALLKCVDWPAILPLFINN